MVWKELHMKRETVSASKAIMQTWTMPRLREYA